MILYEFRALNENEQFQTVWYRVAKENEKHTESIGNKGASSGCMLFLISVLITTTVICFL